MTDTTAAGTGATADVTPGEPAPDDQPPDTLPSDGRPSGDHPPDDHAPDDHALDDHPPHRPALVAALLTVAPHVAVETRPGGTLFWVDARGLPARRVARAVLRLARQAGAPASGAAAARVGMARTAVAAELAATTLPPDVRRAGVEPPPITVVPPGTDEAFLAPLPLAALARAAAEPDAPGTNAPGTNAPGAGAPRGGRHAAGAARPEALVAALRDVGLETCGDLARLTRAAVELRFGAAGVALWRLARADATVRTRHPLALFPPRPRALPSASLAWDDYAVRDLERLAFVVNRLAATVCDGLRAWGEGARAMTVRVALADRTALDCPVRAARATASRRSWARLVRAALDRATLPDAVVGLALRVDAAGDVGALQGDLFDRGFQAGAAVAEALAQIVDDGRATIVGLAPSHHPLLERRARWRARELGAVLQEDDARAERAAAGRAAATRASAAALALQLLPAPRRVVVTTTRRRAHDVPVRFADPAPERERGPWPADVPLLTAAGPDHVSGGEAAGAPYAREYFHALTADGVLVLLFRDAAAPEGDGAWYVHGWWD
ncbi:MAG TPA: hypothetical protein VFS08_20090 [Gemmatimonadaceae bacterium]|nr:hypothetical protein [Gemmatimonadaceae bacterium]